MRKLLLIVAGWLCVALALIGIFLPVLPTTPFLILAATCFAKSSQRFHRWLLNSHYFGPIIQDWQQTRAVQPQIKKQALLLVVITFTISIAVVPLLAVRVLLLATMTACLFFIWRLPEKPL